MIRPDTTAAKGGAMALIQCPDCGSSVSDAAPACPKCARPIAAAAPMPRTAAPPQKKTGVSAGFTLLVLLALGSWIYYQATSSSASPGTDSSQASAPTVPAGTSPQPDAAPVGPSTFVTTPGDLYRQYAANEVATDQSIGGRIVQFTAPVQAIDKDFTDSAVLKFSTGDEFGELQAVLDDSEKSAAAGLSQGELVTVRCKKMRRIMNSPMGDDCTFEVAAPSDPTGTTDQAPADSGASKSSAAESSNAPAVVSTVANTGVAAGIPAASSSPESGAEQPTVLQQVEANTAGPSFDCEKASDPTATTICSNADLSLLDRQMAILYYSRTNYATDSDVREQQRAWIRDRDASCVADVVCLRAKYEERIQQLQQEGGGANGG